MLNLLSPLAVAGTAAAAAVTVAQKVAQGSSFLSLLTAPDEAAGSGDSAASGAIDDSQIEASVQRIREQLTALGVNLSEPLSLKRSVTGGVEVGSEHPDWSRIEEAIQQNPGLAAEVESLLSAVGQTTDKLSPNVQLQILPSESVITIDEQVHSRFAATEQ